ncbi:IQ motif and ankyrin repeat domain-containing protein 1-like [Styela clava]
MPPKRPPAKASVPAARNVSNKKQPVKPAANTANKKPGPPGRKAPPAKAAPKKEEKKGPSPQDLAAIVIQKYIRRFLSQCDLKKLKNRRIEYDEMIEKLQREAFVAMVKAEQGAAEREQAREDEERRRKREEAKRRGRMLEAAFDGDLEEMENILKEVSNLDTKNGVPNDEMGKVIRRNHMIAVTECQDANGNTPLSEAAAGGSSESIKFLVERGGDVNSVGAWGRTPLYRAAFGGHLDAVESLLQYGADPRIIAEDGNAPEHVSPVEAIIEVLKNWDVSMTDSLLEKMVVEREKRLEEDRMRKEAETNQLQDELNEIKKQYESEQRVLQKAYQELEKRIHEHDKCTTQGADSSITEITLQALHDAEGELEIAKLHADKARSKLEQARLRLREQQHEGGDEALPGVKCNIRELDEVLMRDVGNRITESGKWPMLIDPTGQATTFLRYRDTNYLCALNPQQMQPDVIRLALLGSIRFGKPMVMDMLEVDMFDTISDIFNEILPNLMQDIMSKEILQEEKYMQLVKPEDGEAYQKSKFQHHRAQKFIFVLVTKNKFPSDYLIDLTYAIRIVLPGD